MRKHPIQLFSAKTTAVFCLFFCYTTSHQTANAAEIYATKADEQKIEQLLRQNQPRIKNFYDKYNWPFNKYLEVKVETCTKQGNSNVPYGRYTCFVCSIDHIGRHSINGKKLPSTAVAYHAAHAIVKISPENTRLENYEPFGGNYRAMNYEYYHSSRLPQMKQRLSFECGELQRMQTGANVIATRENSTVE